MKLHTSFSRIALGYTCALLLTFSTASSATPQTSQQTQAGQNAPAKPADTSQKGLCKCVIKFKIKNMNYSMPTNTSGQQDEATQEVTDKIPTDNPILVSVGGKVKLGIMTSKQQCADYIKKIAENGNSNSSSLDKAKFSCKWKDKAMAIPVVSPGVAGQPTSAANVY